MDISRYILSLLRGFIEALDLKGPSLVGISMGGAVALGFTLSHPRIPKKLVLVDSYGLQDRAPAHKLSYLFIRLPFVNELTWAILARSRSLARSTLRAIFHDPANLTEELVDSALAEARKPRAGAAWRTFQRNEALWRGMPVIGPSASNPRDSWK